MSTAFLNFFFLRGDQSNETVRNLLSQAPGGIGFLKLDDRQFNSFKALSKP